MSKKLSQKILKTWQKGRNVLRHRKALATFLNFRERTQPGFEGSVSPEELEFLSDLVRCSNEFDGPIVEVGTLFGFTTQVIACWKAHSKSLITIDDYSWNPVGLNARAHQDFTRRSLHYLTEKCHVTLFEGLSSDFYSQYKGPTPSMLFIDASHEYEHVLADINWGKNAGVQIITGHDYSKFWPGVTRAVNEAFGAEAVQTRGTLWAWRRSD